MLGSKDGYITWFWVALSISYAYWEYPDVVPALLDILISFTVCTPSILSNLIYKSLKNIGWFNYQLSILKCSWREVIHLVKTLLLLKLGSTIISNITPILII